VAFKWNNGSASTLYWPPSFDVQPDKWSVALSVNDACTVVGYVGMVGYYQRPSFWRVNDTYATELSVLNPGASNPLDNAGTDINQRNDLQSTGGVIAGNNATANGKVHAVAWIPDGNGNYGAVTDLQDIGDGFQYSYAGAINSQGVVVGKGQRLGANNYHAFRSRAVNGQPQPLDAQSDDMGTATFVDGHATEGNDINDLGEMVGASDCPCGKYHSVYKSPLSAKNVGYYDIGVLGQGTSDEGDQSIALAISAKGLIVGRSTLKIGGLMKWRAFVVSNQGNPGSQPMLNLAEQSWVWTGTQWQRADLNGWVLTSAERVNREGWIVGYGTKNSQTHAFVLSPR
jgi:hypothetical protein